MYIVAIAWMFVVVCMAAVEAVTSSVVGGFATLLLYGLLPLGLVLWLFGTPQRRRDRARAGASFGPRDPTPAPEDITEADRSRSGPPSDP